MAVSFNVGNLERELVCFICTEILYQPLTCLDCLHSFCGACLKEWFSHQHRKATSSRSSSSSSHPYTCPTCRAGVRDVQRNAMVNTFLDMFLASNPDKHRNEEEKLEMDKTYKSGDNIMPKVEGRRRERRARRDEEALEARERRMIEEARERSLRDMRDAPTTGSQDSLQIPATSRQNQSSRSRDREGRRERRREQERQAERTQPRSTASDLGTEEGSDAEQRRGETLSASVPTSSPRHPEAVEARQRQQTVIHQPSLTSLISSSESGTGSGNSDSLNEARIMQEILAGGLLEGIDVDALSEAEQDALAERIAEAYRQSVRERNRRNNPCSDSSPQPLSGTNGSFSQTPNVVESRRHQRMESGSRQRRAETLPNTARDSSTGPQPRSTRTAPVNGSDLLPPPSSIIVTHRSRASSQGQRSDTSRNRSRQASPAARSSHSRSQSTVTDGTKPQSQEQVVASEQTGSNNAQTPPNTNSHQTPEVQSHTIAENARPKPNSEIVEDTASQSSIQGHASPSQRSAGLPVSDPRGLRSGGQQTSQSANRNRRRNSGLYDEPSLSCFRCHRADIQYEVHRHCDRCDINLCSWCYRTGKGCKHWFGFRQTAMEHFDSLQTVSHEQVELPHSLILGRQYKQPDDVSIVRTKMAKDGTTFIPVQTTSNPADRMDEGRFCDRCDAFANDCFWSCDFCNWGEWGFCRNCVNTHHCCTHPLLPIAHKSFAPASRSTRIANEEASHTSNELLSSTLHPFSSPSQPSPAASATSTLACPFPDFEDLTITTRCDICSQAIPMAAYRFHCPFHPSPSSANPAGQGDYDICSPCYQNLVKTNRIKRDDGSAGWRKCPSGHRMIITTFQTDDNDGGQRRVVINDLVGGWQTQEEAMRHWNAELEARRDQNNGDGLYPMFPNSPDGSTARRLMRARTGSPGTEPTSPTGVSPFNSNSRFPPDGGTGLRGTAWYSHFPYDIDRGPLDLLFPGGAEIREIRIDENFPDWCGGVYAGDVGMLPASFVRI